MSRSLGRPVVDLDDFLDPEPPPPVTPPPEPPPPRSRRHHAVWWIIGAVGLVGLAATGYRLLIDTGVPTPAAAGPAATANPLESGVPGFAELFLTTYLTGAAEAVDEFMPAGGPQAKLTRGARYVTGVAAIETAPVAADYWSVVVAADVLVRTGGTYRPAGLQYYQVGVVDDGGRLVAVALPARVPGPPPRAALPRSLQAPNGEPSDTQVALVGDFLEALLIGGRDLGRYVTPNSGIRPIAPPPYATITITSLSLYTGEVAAATVDATDHDGATMPLQYTMRFATVGSRVGVAELTAGPPRNDAPEPGP